MDLQKEYQETIYEWVKQNFGESEADDPSWSIEELANVIAKKHMQLHEEMIRTDLAGAIAGIAEDNGIKLTDKELDAVVDEYRYSGAYCEDDVDAVLHFIHEVKGE